MRDMQHPWLVVAIFSLSCASGGVVTACGSSAASTLITVKSATGSGQVDFSVENATESVINNVYLAKSSRVRDAGGEANRPGSSAEAALWGPDLLGNAIPVGQRVGIPVAGDGPWDLRAVDRDGRYQHIAELKIGPGGRYILKLGEGSWRVPK
jgi:hypothetical protein